MIDPLDRCSRVSSLFQVRRNEFQQRSSRRRKRPRPFLMRVYRNNGEQGAC